VLLSNLNKGGQQMQITKQYPEALETVSSSFFGLSIETQTQQAP
jgi:hypothetical protein